MTTAPNQAFEFLVPIPMTSIGNLQSSSDPNGERAGSYHDTSKIQT